MGNFFCDSICVFQLGENKWYFFPPVSIFFPLGLYFFPSRTCNICSTFTGGVLGEYILSLCVNVFPLCLCFSPWPWCMVLTLPSFLDSFFDMSLRRNNIIFSPWSSFFLFVTEKLMGERKMVFFPISIFFPPLLYLVHPSQTFTVLRCTKMMIFTLGLKVHSSACKLQFNDFVMNNPDNCSFNHFFFLVYFYQVPFSLLLW